MQKFKSKEWRVFVYTKKQTSTAAYIYDSIDICIHFVQFVHCVYVQKSYKICFSQLVVQVLCSLYIVCMYKKHIFQVLSCFQFECCTSFVQFGHFFVYMQQFDVFLVHSLSYKILICTIFEYKIYANLVFFVIFLYILYSFCTHFLVRVATKRSLPQQVKILGQFSAMSLMEVCPYGCFQWHGQTLGVICYNSCVLSEGHKKLLQGLLSHELKAYFSVFDLFLTQ